MIIILFKSLGKRTSIGSYYDEKSLTKCYWDGVSGFFRFAKKATNPVPMASTPSLFGSVSNSKLIWSHMIVFFETFIKMSCISKM